MPGARATDQPWQARRSLATEGSSSQAGSFLAASRIGAADRAAGGPRLRATCLSEELFAAAGMQTVQKDLMSMKVTELKEKLEARGEPRTGSKAWLRRQLHAVIVRAHLEAVEEEDGL